MRAAISANDLNPPAVGIERHFSTAPGISSSKLGSRNAIRI